MRLNDAHCHFFSRHFFEVLARDDPRGRFQASPVEAVCAALSWGVVQDPPAVGADLGWAVPGDAPGLASQWLAALDFQKVSRAALIASVPGDEDSVAAAI